MAAIEAAVVAPRSALRSDIEERLHADGIVVHGYPDPRSAIASLVRKPVAAAIIDLAALRRRASALAARLRAHPRTAAIALVGLARPDHDPGAGLGPFHAIVVLPDELPLLPIVVRDLATAPRARAAAQMPSGPYRSTPPARPPIVEEEAPGVEQDHRREPGRIRRGP